MSAAMTATTMSFQRFVRDADRMEIRKYHGHTDVSGLVLKMLAHLKFEKVGAALLLDM